MNEARLKIIEKFPASLFGHNVFGFTINPEMHGAMAVLRFSTNETSVEIRCTHDWALAVADRINKRISEFKQDCQKENIIPIQATP